MSLSIYAAKLLSLAALLGLLYSHGQAQRYGLYREDGGILGVIDYRDSSFLSVRQTRPWTPSPLYFTWARFSEQGDSIIIHSSPFEGLPEYSLWESKTFASMGEYSEYNFFCIVKNDSNKHGIVIPAFEPEDTISSFYVKLSTRFFSCRSWGESRVIAADSLDLLFEDGYCLTIACNSKDQSCYTCRFDYKDNPAGRRIPKSIRLKIKENHLPWYELEAENLVLIKLVYLNVSRQCCPDVEHFHNTNGYLAKRLNRRTWFFENEKVRLKPLKKKGLDLGWWSTETFKHRPDDPAFNFKVLDVLPRGCTDEMRQYSPHLEPEQPTKARPKPKRRVRQRRLR